MWDCHAPFLFIRHVLPLEFPFLLTWPIAALVITLLPRGLTDTDSFSGPHTYPVLLFLREQMSVTARPTQKDRDAQDKNADSGVHVRIAASGSTAELTGVPSWRQEVRAPQGRARCNVSGSCQ